MLSLLSGDLKLDPSLLGKPPKVISVLLDVLGEHVSGTRTHDDNDRNKWVSIDGDRFIVEELSERTHRLGARDIGGSLASDHVSRGRHCGGSGSEKRSSKHCERKFVC